MPGISREEEKRRDKRRKVRGGLRGCGARITQTFVTSSEDAEQMWSFKMLKKGLKMVERWNETATYQDKTLSIKRSKNIYNVSFSDARFYCALISSNGFCCSVICQMAEDLTEPLHPFSILMDPLQPVWI